MVRVSGVGKISMIGAGNVGATAGQKIAEKNLTDELLFVDVVEGLPQGRGLDLYESAPVVGFNTRIRGTNNYGDIEGSDIVVVTAGLARKPGMTRSDLLDKNAAIMTSVSEKIRSHAPDAVVIVVTNPMDTMTYLLMKKTGFKKNKVLGQAGVLDTSRFRTFVAMELNLIPSQVVGFVLGGHGPSMVPVISNSSVGGVPLDQLLPASKIEEIIKRTRMGGDEIVNYLKTGSAYYAPAAAIYDMVKSIALNERKILPCSAYLEGEYGISDIYTGVPVVLGRNGVESIVQLKISQEENDALKSSAEAVKKDIALLKEHGFI